jgi:hypothetical protein
MKRKPHMRRFICNFDGNPVLPSRSGCLALAFLAFVLLATDGVLAATRSAKMAVAPKWGRFEHSFHSTAPYTNPLQEAALTVIFTSPLGEKREVPGFWDGGRTWRVRFSPDQPGIWTFTTTCSDAFNAGLNNQTGKFLCTSAIGESRFHQHGPVVIARDHRHLEHADGQPFFWLADATARGAQLASLPEWERYALTRGKQQFTVIQWAVAPGADGKGESAFGGFPDRIELNPDFFQRLDAKIDVLTHVSLLSAICPLLEDVGSRPALHLSDEQATLLVRYVLARWGAEPVVWVLNLRSDREGKNAVRWKHIGQAVFGQGAHAPVMLVAGDSTSSLDQFRDEKWIDIFGFQLGSDASSVKNYLTGPLSTQWGNIGRPMIAITPSENEPVNGSTRRITADFVRQCAWWGLLAVPPAGVSYSANGVVEWDASVEGTDSGNPAESIPLWHRALFMPAARQMGNLASFMNSIPYAALRPSPQLLAVQPGNASAEKFVAAAGTEAKDFTVVYDSQERALEIVLDAMPSAPKVTWFNPRTGQSSPAVAVVGGNSCQFPTPEPGDWVLQIKTGK